MIERACDAVLTDIEGTLGSIAFVRTVLFPYAAEHLADFVAAHGNEPAVRAMLRETAALAAEPEASDERLVAVLRAWIAADRKATPLKTLQGLIWADGYARKAFTGHVYADAVAALRTWHAAGIPIYVYSSGSIAAQQLLFRNSDHGDLTPLFAGYFDTTIGPKTEPASYRAIAAAVGLPPRGIVFLSDHEGELDAARAAELQTIRLLRPQDSVAGDVSEHPTVPDCVNLEFRRNSSPLFGVSSP
jgi:enolase-phosphatase E1